MADINTLLFHQKMIKLRAQISLAIQSDEHARLANIKNKLELKLQITEKKNQTQEDDDDSDEVRFKIKYGRRKAAIQNSMEQIIGTEQQIQPSKAELEKLVLDMAALQRDANAIVMERRQQSIIGKSLDDKAAFFHNMKESVDQQCSSNASSEMARAQILLTDEQLVSATARLNAIRGGDQAGSQIVDELGENAQAQPFDGRPATDNGNHAQTSVLKQNINDII